MQTTLLNLVMVLVNGQFGQWSLSLLHVAVFVIKLPFIAPMQPVKWIVFQRRVQSSLLLIISQWWLRSSKPPGYFNSYLFVSSKWTTKCQLVSTITYSLPFVMFWECSARGNGFSWKRKVGMCRLTDDEEGSNNRILKINNPILSGCFRVEITMRIAIQYCNDHCHKMIIMRRKMMMGELFLAGGVRQVCNPWISFSKTFPKLLKKDILKSFLQTFLKTYLQTRI